MKRNYVIAPLGLRYVGRRPEGTITLNGELMYEIFIEGKEESIALIGESKLPRIEKKLGSRVLIVSENKFREWEEVMETLYSIN